MAPIEFRAPWSARLRKATARWLAAAAVALAFGVLARDRLPAGASAALIVLPLIATALAACFMVRGYVLGERELTVQRLFWSTPLPLAGLQSVKGDAEALQRLTPLFGAPGLFAYAGVYWNRRLGRFRALATDPERAVVLRYSRRTVVISPNDPQLFIMRARTLLKYAQFESAAGARR
jgi:hypothetical protein